MPFFVDFTKVKQKIENMEILNSIQFGMFIFYRKSFRRYKLMHIDYNVNDFGGSEEEIQNEIVALNAGIEKVLVKISEDIDKLIELESSIIKVELCAYIVEIVRECDGQLRPGLPFGIMEGGERLGDTIYAYMVKFDLLDKWEELDE